MNAKVLKDLIGEIPDHCEVIFQGEIDGEIKQVDFDRQGMVEYAHVTMIKPQQMIVEIECRLRLPFFATSKADAINQAEECELPDTYKEDSFTIIRVENVRGEEL